MAAQRTAVYWDTGGSPRSAPLFTETSIGSQDAALLLLARVCVVQEHPFVVHHLVNQAILFRLLAGQEVVAIGILLNALQGLPGVIL